MMAFLRSMLFYVGYIVVTVLWGTLSLIVGGFLSYETRFDFIIRRWTGFVLWWLRVTCNIDTVLQGEIPKQPCIVFVKHASTWETLFVQQLFLPQATLIKRELLNIPFFGWAFRLLRPIAIDRGDPRRSLRNLIKQGTERLTAGVWVVLFPEGTRAPVGEQREFQAGGAALARASGSPVLVVAHNAGQYWPAHKFRKVPGTITVRLSPLIETRDKTTKEINAEAEAWLAGAMSELEAPDYKPAVADTSTGSAQASGV